MTTTHKLRKSKERLVAIAYFCGARPADLARDLPIGVTSIKDNIANKYSREWNDPLVEFYRGRSRVRNAAHLYLRFHGVDVQGGDLIDLSRDAWAFRALDKSRFKPAVDRIEQDTQLAQYLRPDTPLERFVYSLSPFQDEATKFIRSRLLPRLREREHQLSSHSLSRMLNETSEDIRLRVKNGGCAMTPVKKDFFFDALRMLSARERAIVLRRNGINTTPTTLQKLGEAYGVTYERIRQIEEKAIDKLTSSEKIQLLCGMCTDQEVVEFYRRSENQDKKTAPLLRSSDLVDA